MDPATLSINTVRGEAMHAVFHYALWLRRKLEQAPDAAARLERGFDEFPEVRDVLESHLDQTQEPSLAIRAVYGQWFPWLVLLDATWARAHIGAIFPTAEDASAFHNAAWETYIVSCHPYDNVYDALKDQYATAINRIPGRTKSRRHPHPEERLAEHLMVFYWRGKNSFSDPAGHIAQFFEKASDELRSRAIEFIGRSVANTAGDIEEPVMRHLVSLWEWRASLGQRSPQPHTEELAAFGWWFSSQKFNPEWAVDQLLTVLRLSHKIEPVHLVIERLAEIAQQWPAKAVSCLTEMISNDRDGWQVLGCQKEIRSIIGLALDSRNPQAIEIGRALVDTLGRKGYLEFRDLLRN